MVPWKTFNIHGIFSFHKRFFIEEKVNFNFLNILHTKKKEIILRIVNWKVLRGTKNGLIFVNTFLEPLFLRVANMEYPGFL